MNSTHFGYRNVFHLHGTIIDEKPDRTLDLSQEIDKISRFNVVMKKFPEAVIGKVGMSTHWVRMGAIPSLCV